MSYLRDVERAGSVDLAGRTDTRGMHDVRLAQVEVSGADGTTLLATGRPARFVFRTRSEDPTSHRRLSCSFTILNAIGQPIATLTSNDRGRADVEDDAHRDVFVCELDELPLVPGRYRIDVEIHGRSHLQDGVEGAAMFDVEQGTLGGRPIAGGVAGDVAIAHRWVVPSLD